VTTYPAGVDEAEFTRVYKKALRYAVTQTKGRPQVEEAAEMAATDACMWALQNYDQTRANANTVTNFAAFTWSAVSRFVSRAIVRSEERRKRAPSQLSDFVEACGDEGGEIGEAELDALAVYDTDGTTTEEGKICLPESIQSLPPDLAFTVRLFYIDKYSLRDIELLTGVSKSTVQVRLIQAAKLLSTDQAKRPERHHKAKRLCRG
jgi:DNA-directed RNA polymerase specialized sigma24 family protein